MKELLLKDGTEYSCGITARMHYSVYDGQVAACTGNDQLLRAKKWPVTSSACHNHATVKLTMDQ